MTSISRLRTEQETAQNPKSKIKIQKSKEKAEIPNFQCGYNAKGISTERGQ
jgi:hypothetical protein